TVRLTRSVVTADGKAFQPDAVFHGLRGSPHPTVGTATPGRRPDFWGRCSRPVSGTLLPPRVDSQYNPTMRRVLLFRGSFASGLLTIFAALVALILSLLLFASVALSSWQ